MIRTAIFLTALVLAFPADAQTPPAWKTFGPSRGMVCEYQVTVFFKKDGREQEIDRPFQIQVFRASAQADRVAVIRPDMGDSAGPGGIPILLYHLAQNGNAAPDAHHGGEMVRTLIAEVLFTGWPASSLTSKAKWKENCTTLGDLAIAGVIEHKAERGADLAGGRPGSLRVTSQRTKALNLATPISTNVVGWEREVVADEATERPLTATVAVEFALKNGSGGPGESPGTMRYRMDLEETSRRPLARWEDAGLGGEIAQLEDIINAAGVKKAGAPGTKTLELSALLDSYEKAHPQGALRSVAAQLRTTLGPRGGQAPEGPGVAQVAELAERAERTAPPHSSAEAIEARRASLIGGPAPGFTLKDLEGKDVSLSDFLGKVVMLTFWGVGCGPCRAEAPYLSELQNTYGDQGLIVLAVNGYDETKDVVEKFVRSEKLNQKVLLQGRRVASGLYFVEGFPTIFFIDRKGIVLERDVGFTPDKVASFRVKIKHLLAKRG